MRTRITYLIDDAEGENPVEISESGNQVKLSGLQGEKHVRVVATGERPGGESVGPLYLSWAKDINFDVPFDAPVEKGLHIDAAPETNWQSLVPWLAQCGIELDPDEVVQAPNWDSYTSLKEPTFECLKKYGISNGAYAIKITSGYADAVLPGVGEDEIVIEAWYSRVDWFETIENHGTKTEVGFLSVDKLSEPSDITLYGLVHTLGGDSKRIMFHHIPAYRKVPGQAVAAFDENVGLHPVFKLKMDVDRNRVPYGCQLFAQIDLPKSLFIDKYQMGDLPRVSPPLENIGVWGETDLEKPVWQVSQGSLALFRLDGAGYNETYNIPLHARYERPSSSLHSDHVMGDPLVFWACQDDNYPKQHVPGLGFESAFSEDTVFYVVPSNELPYRVPVIDPEPRDFVYNATSLMVVGGALLIIAVIIQQVFSRQPKVKRD